MKRKILPSPVGRPTSYRPEYPAMLIEHFKRGMNFIAFGGAVEPPVTTNTLYEWLKRHPEFKEARKAGRNILSKFYIHNGLGLMVGQAKVLKSETPMIGANGKPMVDPSTGATLMDRQYQPAKVNASIYIWLTKNILGWRAPEKVQHEILRTTAEDMRTDIELLEECDRLRRARVNALEVINGGKKTASR